MKTYDQSVASAVIAVWVLCLSIILYIFCRKQR
jgi:hypothetical protein